MEKKCGRNIRYDQKYTVAMNTTHEYREALVESLGRVAEERQLDNTHTFDRVRSFASVAYFVVSIPSSTCKGRATLNVPLEQTPGGVKFFRGKSQEQVL